ncbi:MarR family winged helix-turn-helix transcriptional regulator [Nocardia sp. CDC160]|uniref:MarR family winged helix-turn-helix transcriptional regulator n=1 Tax=Nocardia sp. CDC160 TaxID=3112166 RepID=UPI002DB84255|nr:MarR family transcriptional regulator [Nocardia sp. CDC160]MEC3914452.1 MarR family transcriptional regulator [Nocardia sp. CDC160]
MNEAAILMNRIAGDLARAGDRILRAELGISYSRVLVLLALDLDGPASQQDLARWLGSTAPAVTGLLGELSAAGYVQVSADPDNRRRNRVDLTGEGQRIIRAARALLDRSFDELLRKADVDGAVLVTALSRIAATIQKAGD